MSERTRASSTHSRKAAIRLKATNDRQSIGSVIWDFDSQCWAPDPNSESEEIAVFLRVLASTAIAEETLFAAGEGRIQFTLQLVETDATTTHPEIAAEIARACYTAFHNALSSPTGIVAPITGEGGGFILTVKILASRSEARHARVRLRAEKKPTAAKLESEIDAFHKAFVPKLHAWLKIHEGTQFESLEEAQREIDAIVRLVRRSGRQLLYEGQPVTLAAACSKRQRTPSIQVRGRQQGQRVMLLNTVRLPLFATAPAD